MAPHSSTLAWKVQWMEEPGRLQSMGSLGVGHDWATSLSLFTFMHWRKKWQPTPVFLPGESQRWGSLVGCRLWGCTESDTTEATWQQQQPVARGRDEVETGRPWQAAQHPPLLLWELLPLPPFPGVGVGSHWLWGQQVERGVIYRGRGWSEGRSFCICDCLLCDLCT